MGRSMDDPAQALGGLRKKVNDNLSTMNARVIRRPTGTVEPTFLTSAKSGTLLLDGQTVNGADYPVLWQWVQDNSPAGFGITGSNTFTVPDMRNRLTVAGGAVALNFLVWT